MYPFVAVCTEIKNKVLCAILVPSLPSYILEYCTLTASQLFKSCACTVCLSVSFPLTIATARSSFDVSQAHQGAALLLRPRPGEGVLQVRQGPPKILPHVHRQTGENVHEIRMYSIYDYIHTTIMLLSWLQLERLKPNKLQFRGPTYAPLFYVRGRGRHTDSPGKVALLQQLKARNGQAHTTYHIFMPRATTAVSASCGMAMPNRHGRRSFVLVLSSSGRFSRTFPFVKG